MAYIVLAILFGGPLLLFLKTQHAFSGFNLVKFSKALNRAGYLYLAICFMCAFLIAYLETYVYLDSKGTPTTDMLMDAATTYLELCFVIILPLIILLMLIRLFFGKKLVKASAQPETTEKQDTPKEDQ